MKKTQKNNNDPQVQSDTPIDEKDHLIQELEEKVALHLAGWQRAQADYQNLKRESDRILTARKMPFS